jgi:hypothetical protein
LCLAGLAVAWTGCGGSEDPADSDSAISTTSAGASDGSSGGDDTEAPDSTGGTSDGSDAGGTTAPTSDTSSTGSTAGTAGGSSGGDESGSTGGSDSGGAATGLEGFCERYFECGGSYYSDVQSCMDASLGFWGDCTEARAALDAFGDCMITIPCEDYDPDAYNPANTDCAEQWQDVQQSSC